MISVLDVLEDKCNNWISANDLLDEICIEIGAKKQKLIHKINHYK